MIVLVLMFVFVAIVSYLLWANVRRNSLVLITAAGTYNIEHYTNYRVDALTGPVNLVLPLAAAAQSRIEVFRSQVGQDAEINFNLQGSDENSGQTVANNPIYHISAGSPTRVAFASDGVDQWYNF